MIQIQEIHTTTRFIPRFNPIYASQPTRAIRYSRHSSSGQPWLRYTRRGHGYPVLDLMENATIRTHGTFLERLISRTDTALLLTTKWHIVVKNIILIDPDLRVLVSFVVVEYRTYLTVPASKADDTR
jgi:hypothetical protein